MEGKLIMWILAFIGVPSYLWGLLLNIGTWKADVLFVVSLIFSMIYSIFFVRKLIYNDKMRGIKLRRAIRELDNEEDSSRPSEIESKIGAMNSDIFRNIK